MEGYIYLYREDRVDYIENLLRIITLKKEITKDKLYLEIFKKEAKINENFLYWVIGNNRLSTTEKREKEISEKLEDVFREMRINVRYDVSIFRLPKGGKVYEPTNIDENIGEDLIHEKLANARISMNKKIFTQPINAYDIFETYNFCEDSVCKKIKSAVINAYLNNLSNEEMRDTIENLVDTDMMIIKKVEDCKV